MIADKYKEGMDSPPTPAPGDPRNGQQGEGRQADHATFLRRRRRNNRIIALALFAFCAAVFAWFIYRTAGG